MLKMLVREFFGRDREQVFFFGFEKFDFNLQISEEVRFSSWLSNRVDERDIKLAITNLKANKYINNDIAKAKCKAQRAVICWPFKHPGHDNICCLDDLNDGINNIFPRYMDSQNDKHIHPGPKASRLHGSSDVETRERETQELLKGAVIDAENKNSKKLYNFDVGEEYFIIFPKSDGGDEKNEYHAFHNEDLEKNRVASLKDIPSFIKKVFTREIDKYRIK